jgi:integrase/recombinase XerD
MRRNPPPLVIRATVIAAGGGLGLRRSRRPGAGNQALALKHEGILDDRGARPLAAAEVAAIDEFCDQVWLQDGLAATTLASYRQDLTQWAAWLAARSSAMHRARRADVEAFIAAQFAARAKVTSINRRLSSLRRFYQLQLQRGTLKEDPCLRVKAPKLPRRLPKKLSESQVVALLNAPDSESLLGLRDRTMLETLYATGLRVSELVGLKLGQVRPRHGCRSRARQAGGQQGAAGALGEEAMS